MLEHGQVSEEGTHKMLMKKQGVYAEMYTKQAENYLAASVTEAGSDIFAVQGEVEA